MMEEGCKSNALDLPNQKQSSNCEWLAANLFEIKIKIISGVKIEIAIHLT
jgi:hypothetical protein